MFRKAARMAGFAALVLLSGCAAQGGSKIDWREDPMSISADRPPFGQLAGIDRAHRTPIRRGAVAL